MALAVAVMTGCGKQAQSENAETPATEDAVEATEANAGEAEAANVPTEEEIIEAESVEPVVETPKRDIGSLKSFFGYKSNEAYLIGKIDNKYAVHMSLWWYVGHNYEYNDATGEQEVAYLYTLYGAYYYDSTKNGLKNYLELSEDMIDKNRVIISEYNKNGDLTGTFDGRVKGNVYEGQFIRAKDGKRMPFKLTYVDNENNGKFVAPMNML